MKLLLQVTLLGTVLFSSVMADTLSTKERLGKALYKDKNLSKNRKMACATCHHKKSAFIDIRRSPIGHMAALSANARKAGDRNVPTTAYASFIPKFHQEMMQGPIHTHLHNMYVGGQFLDGRASTLADQAKGPFLNPVEMQMPNKESVIERVKENRRYRRLFKRVYGNDIFDDIDNSYNALADAIASFETAKRFSPFNSRYDKFLKGKKDLKANEKRGLVLFTTKAKCSSCHTVSSKNNRVLFSNFTYHNLGIPVNKRLRAINGKGEDFIDHGLLSNPEVDDIAEDGKFRTVTLRNVAVTSPYMHNGIFKDLKTVVHFYNTRDVEGAINPETQREWDTAEVPSTVVNPMLIGNLGLTDSEEDDIVAFLKTLTDKRYRRRAFYSR